MSVPYYSAFNSTTLSDRQVSLAVLWAFLVATYLFVAIPSSKAAPVTDDVLAPVQGTDVQLDELENEEAEEDEEAEEEEEEEWEWEARRELREYRELQSDIEGELQEAREAGDAAAIKLQETRRDHLRLEQELLSRIVDLQRLMDRAESTGADEVAEEIERTIDSWIEQWEQKQRLHELTAGLLELELLTSKAEEDAQLKHHTPQIEKLASHQRELLKMTRKLFRAFRQHRAAEAQIDELEEECEALADEVEAEWARLEYALEHKIAPQGEEEKAKNAQGAAIDLSLEDAPALSFSDTKKLLAAFCFECHDQDTQEANLNLEDLLTHDPLVQDRDAWRRAIQLIQLNSMPPEEMPQPTPRERLGMLASLDREINQFDYSQVDDPGFEPARRLSHTEYNHTVRDLLGIDLRPADRFPAELTGASGFDNSASTLFLQSSLMERYIGAAERAIEVALPAEIVTEPQRATRDAILVAKPGGSLSELDAARIVLHRFLTRAYRRPPTDGELDSILARYEGERGAGATFEEATKSVLPAVLISPKFLLRIEAGSDTKGPYRISDWELASRLSYFLWASMPDDELFRLAELGQLRQSDVLQQQVERMLADPRADALGDVFAAQWLSTRLVGTRIRLDPIDNPWCTDSLMTAMREESSLFFMSLVRDDRSIDALIDADYTYLNEELAGTLYDREDIQGATMRRVALDDPNRGGILCQPSVLAVTSGYKQTSPIKRGIYVLDTILGTPPPPPPPNAGELDEALREDRRLTFREKLELHSQNITCRSCHATIDPLGLTLENFDYFGRWRDRYRRRTPIDASAVLPDGTKLSGPQGVKQLILGERHDDFVRQVVSKMLAYGLGRELEYFDEPAIRKIVDNLRNNDYRFQTLLSEIVRSYPYQYRKDPQ